MSLLVVNGKQQFVDVSGAPLVNGKVFFYQPATSILKNTYQDYGQTVLNTNPVILDARGQASIYGSGAYRQVLQGVSGNLIWDQYIPDLLKELSDASTLLTANSAVEVSSVAALRLLDSQKYAIANSAGYYAKGDQGAGRYYLDPVDTISADNGGTVIVGADGGRWKLCHNGTIDTAQFGCSASLSDNSAPFNAASAYVASVGGKLTIQVAELAFASPIFFKNGVIYEGRGVKIDGGGTKFNYTGTSDFALIQNPVNGSTSANVDISGIWFNSTTLSNDSALLFDTASSVVSVKRCRFNSNAIGMTLDQSELWDVRFCSFLCSSATACGVWIVNGNEKNPTSKPFFTNRLAFWGCDFNGLSGAVSIFDDGGTAHAFLQCNFNACGTHIRHTAVAGLLISGGEFEISSAQMFIASLVKRKGSASSASAMVELTSAYFYNNQNLPIYASAANAVLSLTIRNCSINTPAGNVPFTGLETAAELVCEGNRQVGQGGSGAAINNRISNATAIIGWTSLGTQPTIGNGLLVAKYDRVGKEITYRVTLQLGSTSTAGTGNYIFTLPFVHDSPANVLGEVGAAYLSIPGAGYYVCVARVIPGTNTVGIYATSGNPVGAGVPAAFVSGTVLEFQVKCGSLLAI
ncbi:hypothetical protein HX882_18285 [Pseudomonas gingeri]|uniref:Uncharacterized protein n=1 Tax=Pseudomonas gingeri TaxID=117681 RepID=A0A7Y8C406_9PSED|nr:hypothetical protein [Pseudomonas gingeri]NWB97847.1 hypothetical protein [Pseudomonas gingeri]